ncbi:hypothetical protein MVES_001181 [Malassezia vespertilionis]|uniref:RRM domain-containing protein n=1 Tax=Malassezia vespertilionis TaxID=2020962 RepID=A0A2N1JE16_9BASI|nr:hypothetical protein MVES_001181 [Malassezia vespertilionis]
MSSSPAARREELHEDMQFDENVSTEREWQHAQEDDFDRRDARDKDHDPDTRDAPRARSSHYSNDRPRDGGARGAPRRQERPAPSPSHILGAFGLSIRTTERELEEEFSKAGPVEKVVIVYDARTGRSRGFGFITMRDVESATEAVTQINNTELQGRRIRVDFSSTTRAHEPTPGEYRGNPRFTDERERPALTGSSYRGAAYERRSHERDHAYGRHDERRSWGRERGYDKDDRRGWTRDRRDDRRPSYDRDDRRGWARERGDERRGDDRDDRRGWGRDDRSARSRFDAPEWRRNASPTRTRDREASPIHAREQSPRRDEERYERFDDGGE